MVYNAPLPTEPLPPPNDFSLSTRIMGRKADDYKVDQIEAILRHYWRAPHRGYKKVIAWQLKQLEQELGLTPHDGLLILSGYASPYAPPPPPPVAPPPAADRPAPVRNEQVNEYGDADPWAFQWRRPGGWLWGPGPEPIQQAGPFVARDEAAPAPPVLEKPELSHLAAEETCEVCFDTLRRVRFPKRRITMTCQHEPRICLECIEDSIQASISNTRWNLLRCPGCPALLTFDDVKRNASLETFERYDRFATLDVLSVLENFRYCLNPEGCQSGQIHEKETPRMLCQECGFSTCFYHELPWHTGMNCREYDQYVRENAERQQQQEAVSQMYLNENTKVCPGPTCGVRIVKGNDMCDHMTCSLCHYEFCWRCLADFNEIRALGAMAHNIGCRLRDNRLPQGAVHLAEHFWTADNRFRFQMFAGENDLLFGNGP